MAEHIDTTQINELPIIPKQNEASNEEVIQNMNLSTENRQHDTNSVLQNVANEKKVRFKDQLESTEKKESSPSPSPSQQFTLTLEHKIIILATFFFFVFMDPKFKKYILNIFVQIFGSYLKTEMNQMNKIGMFLYSLFYAILLFICVRFVDLASFHLSF